ncbi:MAG: hypothetical protein KAU21_04725 [Gammaproteobacteria bacterium]|nr:hypothetical protein [Gammaproteobacteria bacterium]
MSLSFQTNFSIEQKNVILLQMAELALSESATQISSLGHSKVCFKVDSIGVKNKDELDSLLNSDEPDMLAVCHRVDGVSPGEIIFLMKDSAALIFMKEVLQEKVTLNEMSEMEEEALLEMGNIIVNDLLSHYVEILQKSVTTSIPVIRRGHYVDLFNQLSAGTDEKKYFIVKFTVELAMYNFVAYILWLGDLPGLELDQVELSQASNSTG